MSPGFVFYVKFEYNRNVGEGETNKRTTQRSKKKWTDYKCFFVCVCFVKKKRKR